VRITDDNGRLRKLLKKAEWNSSYISLRFRREIFYFTWLFIKKI
jgi:hypothetical protein